jgi:GH25 family lysozyme M1 (1,4-beta-N-acetylmuramidase)
MYTHALRFLACAAALVPAAASAAPASLADRPHGFALGDGLSRSEGPPSVIAKESCAGPETLFGIDVSYYQGDIDWNAVAADGVKYAWVRVSHSTSFNDPKFAQNLAGSRAAGIHTGVYQYFEPTEDPIAQAQLLLDKMGPLQPGDMPPMIDVESTDAVDKASYTAAIGAWLDHIEAGTGTKAMIYTGFYYWNDNVGSDQFIDHPLWIANYNPGCPLIPDYWPTWTFHQYCACASVAGIAGEVDADTFNGNLAALEALAFGMPVCGDAACTGGETPYTCGVDCPPCGVIGAAGGTIDDGQACFELYGPLEYWRQEAAGQGGSLYWTNVTEYADPSNYAVWRMYFAESGTYSLEAWVEQPFGETAQMDYRILHAGGEATVPINQSLQASGWVGLGEFQFTAGTDHWVRADDNTGELVALELAMVADALRITRTDAPPTTTTGEDTTNGEAGSEAGEVGETGGNEGSGGPITSASASDPGTTGDAPTSGGATGVTTPTAGLPEDFGEDDGCGCRGSLSGAPGLLLPLLLWRRRRA